MSRAILQFTQSAAVRELESMLRWMRPAGSETEKRFVRDYVDTIPGIARDGYGNRFLRVGDSPVLWSSHTDSVHRVGGQQTIARDGDLIRLAAGETIATCLGADCATGAWLMRQMALRGVAGFYVWHRDEEIGGHGSSWLAKKGGALFDGIRFAIALDRRGKDSIITHQGERCCSEDFARSIMPMLPVGFLPDDTGVFTDTANYIDCVAECSNLSVGYERAHSKDETQDMRFALELLESLCALDQSRLVESRKPGERESIDWRDVWRGNAPLRAATHGASNFDRLRALIDAYPNLIADWLDMGGVDADELAQDLDANDFDIR
jgi:hypothetical protein